MSRRIWRSRSWITWAAAATTATATLAFAKIQVASGQPARLTVERLASLPSLIGTSPSRPAWSSNGAQLAFLWNDQGWPSRDLWIVGASETAPRRLTDMGKAFPSQDSTDPDPNRSLAQRIEARARGGVSDFVWRPDGGAVVFAYRGDLFRVNVDGSGLTRLTQGGSGGSGLAFSPDGRFVSFLRAGDLWLLNTATNTIVRATYVGVPAIGDVAVGTYHRPDVEVGSYAWAADRAAYVWSPDSKFIAVHYEDRRQMRKVPFPYYLSQETSMNVHRRGYPGDTDEIRAVGIYTLDEGQMRLVDLPDRTLRTIGNVAWSPDGSQLLVDESTDVAEDRWIYVVNPLNRSVHQIWHDHGDRRVTLIATSEWTTDGRGIIFVGDLDDRFRLYSLPLGSSTPTPLTSGAWDVAGPRGAASVTISSRKEIFFVSTQKSPYERQVYRMPERGGAITQVTSMAGTHTPFVSPDGSTLALISSNDATPPELYLIDSSGGAERRITHSPPPEFQQYHWIQPRYVTFKSRTDGFTLHARILEPPNLDRAKKYPVIFGSVYSNTVRNQWAGVNTTLQQYLALEGDYIGVLVDVRGSTGYGRDFREKFLMDWGGGDVEDLQSAVDYLKTLPYVDGNRIGIWGSSYGGLLTVFALFEKPGLFAAGVAGAPAVDPSFFGTDDVEITRLPNTHPEAFRRSALRMGENLQDHLLFIQGMQDDVVPFKTTVMLAERLMMLGKDFDIAIAPTAPHGWSQKEYYAVFMLRKLVQHFDRYLGRGARDASQTSHSAREQERH